MNELCIYRCRLGTMSEDTPVIQEMKKELSSECRTCLRLLNTDEDQCYIFQRWVPPWEGLEDTVAEALQRIAQIQLSDMDPHSKVICETCCEKLYTACLFANLVQQSDYTLWQRCPPDDGSDDSPIDNSWPKPIQIDKNIPLDEQIEIKKEELSDEEYSEFCGVDTAQSDEAGMDIKIEPVELIPREHIRVEMNGYYDGTSPDGVTPDRTGPDGSTPDGTSPDGLTPEVSLNGDDSQQHYKVLVKEEPVSDSESAGTEMSLDCMLCTKVFNSVSGLKAHVIAQHSYKTVRRKAADETSPVKRHKYQYNCATCNRTFATTTDLMVHETCHNKSVCYGCNEKFESFELVMQHRLTCKAVKDPECRPVKTLEDVRRVQRSSSANSENSEESTKELLKCTICGESFTDNYYMNIHLEIHHQRTSSLANEVEEMEVEALENLFSIRA